MTTTPFWQEVRSTVMLRGDGWREVVESLPNRLDASEIKSMVQSVEQLTHCHMEGVAYLAGAPVRATPDPEALIAHLPADVLTPENIVLQWLYQFFIVEGLARAMTDLNSDAPIADWPPMILDLLLRSFQFMVYMSALLTLMEEGFYATAAIPMSEFLATEKAVRYRVEFTANHLCSKTQDYGESFRRHGMLGLIPRLWDKIARIAQLKSKNRTANHEPMQDSARDLLGYSAIAWSLVLEVPAAHNIQKVEIER
jgi:hypothetical protein